MTSINRLPTKTETFAGAALTLVLSISLGFVISFMLSATFRRGEIASPPYIAVLVVLSVIFAWSSALFLRILFGIPQKPSFKGQAAIGYATAAGGAFLCIAPLLPGFGVAGKQLPIQGIVGVVFGLSWAYQAHKGKRA